MRCFGPSAFECGAWYLQDQIAGDATSFSNCIRDHVKSPGTLSKLEWLWDSVVNPILNSLGFYKPSSSDQLPHIWWIPTGIASHLPLHAAGYHLKCTGETALDRVASSYASSVKSIIHSRRRPFQPASDRQTRHSVVVSMKNTPKLEPLRHADAEIDEVLAACKSMGISGKRPQKCKPDLSLALQDCEIFHFAGHGGADQLEPLHSKLLLDDWDSDPFTVAALESNPALNPPFLAYLSACGTGQILDQSSVDESIHLANAFQLAGFRHVIGTLWSVDDALCVDMARIVYELLQKRGMDDECVSRALHHATRTLRDGWVDATDVGRGTRHAQIDAVASDELEREQPLWAPYVHFGV
ncbi:hypothetical protein MGG_08677 [Pyricularia oryzae 70-15]|uniref:CHAT domain-containing protein n=1 Tax=Pyricularia oryzae (strain 70-15 / ATCC MYA-4617 / FGSC 8958) TaxID=242507 RepID=G4MLH5_PYRO7|nr:uncharacterized protein MGG_08677 [Pyricularia oryzae 70-15]EHA58496.1 hypothetical protein MGG_08677 [Pyricularia oryzae 70-15]